MLNLRLFKSSVIVCALTASSFSAVAQPHLQSVNGHLPPILAKVRASSNLPPATQLNVVIGLPLRNRAALTNFLREIYDPASTNYHHYLTPAQFTAQFGPTRQDYAAVMTFAKTNGLKIVATHPNRMLLDVRGSVSNIQKAFHVTMRVYPHPIEPRTFYAADAQPMLELSTPVLDISGLNNYSLPKPRIEVKQLIGKQAAVPNAGSGPSGTFIGSDFRAAYLPDSTLTGSGQVVGLLQFDGYTASDIAYYETKAGLPNVPLQNVLLDGFSGHPTGSGGEVEVSLDIETAISMAPNLSKVIVYMAGPYGNWHDILNRMANDNLAKQLSCSWYSPGAGPDAVADQIWQQMALQGQSFFNASGDNDAYTGLISFPGDSSYITQVGGTTLTTTGPGGARVSETVWNWGNGIGSGGGISTSYPIPSYQTNIDMTANQGSTTKRNTPDVALTADNVYVRADGFDYRVGGTSCAAPLWAGFTALVNQQAIASSQPLIGFINPAVDVIGTGANFTSCFNDITTGNNTSGSSPSKFYAVAGYDLCTGWGTPAGQKLINALANPEPLIITPENGFASIGGVGGPFSVTSQSLTLTNAGTNSFTWSLSNTSLWLNASPSGGSLSPHGATTTVVVSLNTVASNLTVGSYSATLWFTNLNDHVGQGRQFSLSIISPPAITSQPTNQFVLDGQTAVFNVGVTGGVPMYFQWQENGTNISDAGNISGTTSTALTITNASENNIGTYSVIVSNAAGVVTSSNAALVLVASAPVIVTQPATQTVGVGGNVQFSVAAIGTKPFWYQWTFNNTNIDGATNSVLAFTGVQFSQAGDYAVVITNIQGSTLSSNATLTVTPCDPSPSNMVSWWKAEGDATEIINGNNGTLNNGVTFVTGTVGQAFSFNGSNSFVQVPDSPELRLTNSLTIEFWVKRLQIAGRPYGDMIVEKGGDWTGGAENYGVGFAPDAYGNLLQFFFAGGNRGCGNVNDLNWHHCAVVANNGDVNPTFYIDGVQQTVTESQGAGTINLYPSTQPLYIGAQVDPNSGYFYYSDTAIDELSLYNRALTASEIQAVYIAGAAGKCFTPNPPVIVSQPSSLTNFVGNTVAFTVQAAGTPPFSYQWSFNTTNVDGATNSTLVLTNLQLSQAGDYTVLVTNVGGSILSSNATLTVLPVPPCDPEPSGLVSWWKAEGDLTDVIGGNNGSVSNSVGFVSGMAGQAFSFNGSNSFIEVPDSASLRLTNSLTIEFWIKRQQIDGRPYGDNVVEKGGDWTGGVENYGVGIAPAAYGNLLQFFFAGGNRGGGVISDLNWHHCAVVASNGDANPTFYLDGVLQPVTESQGSATINLYPSTLPLHIGAQLDPVTGYYYYSDALLDELSIYNRELSASEVQAIYAAGAGGKCFTPAPPAIIVQPTNETVTEGSTAILTVQATGTPPLSYQWTFNTTNILGATNSTLVLPSVQFSQAGNYAVLVSNIVSSVLSSNAVLTVNPVPPCDPPPSGLVAWWKAEGDGTEIINGYNAGLSNGVIFMAGVVGQAFSFNGSNSYAQVQDSPALRLTNVLTIEFWVKRKQIAGRPYGDMIVEKGGDWTHGVQNYAVGFAPAGYGNLLQFFFANGNRGGGVVSDLNWHHCAVIASNGAANPLFYLDGVLQPVTESQGAPTINLYPSTLPLHIGAQVDSQFNYFSDTAIDELSIYNRALTAAEIQAIYNAGDAGKCVVLAPVITTQPTNLTVTAGNSASFSVAAAGVAPLSYQWAWNSTTIPGATNSALTLSNVQITNAGTYSVQITNRYGSAISSNAILSVVDVLDHFVWNTIASPRFVNAPFSVTVQAQDPINTLFTNFTGTVALSATNGAGVHPLVSDHFVQGIWTGAISISQSGSNTVFQADDGLGHFGNSKPVAVLELPALSMSRSGSYLYIFWPVTPSGFALEKTTTLWPPQWLPVSDPPLQIGNQYLEPMQMTGTNQFFRLRFTNPY